MLDAPQRTFLDSRNREAQDETALLMRQGALEVGIPQATNAHKGHKIQCHNALFTWITALRHPSTNGS